MTFEPISHAERARANRLRNKQRELRDLTEDEKSWLEAYQERLQRLPGGGDVGASKAATRKVTYSEEETAAEAVGTGSAAETAAAAAMVVTAEGRRIDNLLSLSMQIMRNAVETYQKMAQQMLSERAEDAKIHRQLLETVRVQMIERAEAEADLIEAEAEHQAESKDGEGLEAVLAKAALERFLPKNAEELPSGDGKS